MRTITLAVALLLTAAGSARADFGAPQVVTQGLVFNLAAAGSGDGSALLFAAGSPGPTQPFARSAGGTFAPTDVPLSVHESDLHVSVSSAGAAAVAWRDDSPRRYSAIRVAWHPAGTSLFRTALVAGPSAGGVRDPSVTIDDEGATIVVFQIHTAQVHLNVAGDVAIAIKPAGSDRFGAPHLRSPDPAGPPVLAEGADGGAVVAWVRRHRIEAVSVGSDGTVGQTTVLHGGAHHARSVSVAAGASGRAIVAWTEDQRVEQVWMARRGAGGRFSRSRALSAVPARVFVGGLDTAVSADGRGLVAWGETTSGTLPKSEGHNGLAGTVRAAIIDLTSGRVRSAHQVSTGPGYHSAPTAQAVGPAFVLTWFARLTNPNSGLEAAFSDGDRWQRSVRIGPRIDSAFPPPQSLPVVVAARASASILWIQRLSGLTSTLYDVEATVS